MRGSLVAQFDSDQSLPAPSMILFGTFFRIVPASAGNLPELAQFGEIASPRQLVCRNRRLAEQVGPPGLANGCFFSFLYRTKAIVFVSSQYLPAPNQAAVFRFPHLRCPASWHAPSISGGPFSACRQWHQLRQLSPCPAGFPRDPPW